MMTSKSNTVNSFLSETKTFLGDSTVQYLSKGEKVNLPALPDGWRETRLTVGGCKIIVQTEDKWCRLGTALVKEQIKHSQDVKRTQDRLRRKLEERKGAK